ncbi:YscQ/HrcQ family type III secretion apparatus protein [Burkholderia sp. Nafp2/4-1b]|uniref:FliM/FliN family flagellar motor switch protein n=1 Tax=Burkholderia sp. Nafp2/4-1b TaxID=2116686 RepID=UPI000EF95062|nr:FliM/FliN family flagellar motor switch protein [Burkholderia sp. Nafp2/4-1b]RKT98830.1 YscQ/HrcQ family type III secretion apparatus protein [Burkholderia sp. Nafp2/4-1b]
MRALQIDRATLALLRMVGAGRWLALDGGALTMRFGHAGGDGLIVSARTDDGPVRLWVDALSWCSWIEPILSVPSWDATPVELRGALAAWTCACIEQDLGSAGISWLRADAIERGACKAKPMWSLRIEREREFASIDLRIMEAPHKWLEQLARGLDPLPVHLQPDSPRSSPHDEHAAAPAIRLSLAAGWTIINTAMLAGVRAGDALVLQHAYAVTQGELSLYADRPLATVLECRQGSFTIGIMMETFDDWLDVTPTPSQDAGNVPDTPDAFDERDAHAPSSYVLEARVRVVAHVATIDVPLVQLASLRAGDILDGPAQPEDLITLQVAGKPFARGTLLEIGGRLAVRIEQLLSR